MVVVAGCGGSSSGYPSKSISLIVPFAAGGPSDLAARFVGDRLGKELGQSVVVVNRPGAGSAAGLQELAAAKADGHTIGLATSSLISNKHIGAAPVDYSKLAPITLMLNTPGAVAVKAEAPWKTLKEFLDNARSKGNAVRVGNTGTGATWHLMSVILKEHSEVTFTDVPYDGGAPLVAAILGGHIEGGAQSVSGWMPNVKAGKLRVLGVASEKRDPGLPDVPTFKEQGLDVVYGLWTGFLAPKGTPDAIVDRLNDVLTKISKDPQFLDFVQKNGFNVEVKGPAEFAKFLKSEDDRIGGIAKKYTFSTK